ncbi:MAG: hypothetical protein KC543_16255 [Myxococcales bacterium]|nr:hypothetical protein [Myxococcales bacterium]
MSQAIDDLAGACVAAVRAAVGVEPDFTPETLPLVDHYASLAGGASEPVLALTAPMVGAYFGEVVRRHVAEAAWYLPDDDHARWRLELAECVLRFNPVGVAREALTGALAPGWGAHFETRPGDVPSLEAALRNAGPVTEDDYFRLSVRVEVLELAHATLLGAMEARDERGPFGRPDYAAIFER